MGLKVKIEELRKRNGSEIVVGSIFEENREVDRNCKKKKKKFENKGG